MYVKWKQQQKLIIREIDQSQDYYFDYSLMQEQPLFPISCSELPEEVTTGQQSAGCTLFIRLSSQQNEYSANGVIELDCPQYINRHIRLSIVGQWVLQRHLLTSKVLSGFRCDFQIKFWMIRSPPIVQNTVGKLLGISFQFPQLESSQSQTISLFIIEDEEKRLQRIKQLQRFCSVLQKKYIVQKQFHQKYKAIKRIGKGITACVYSSLCLQDKSQVAIKSFKKQVYFKTDNGDGKKGFLKEFKILTMLDSPYLSRLLGVYESQQSIYIVQQLLQRTLHNYIMRFGFPETSLCRKIMFQLLIGLRDLHSKNIMHRDLKLQNVMIRGAGKDKVEPVIVDFGLAQFVGEKQFVYIRCGTPGYVAPEIINSDKEEKLQLKYDKSCDVFSLGVIFHMLLLGKSVFEGKDVREVVQKNKFCEIDYDFKQYPLVSPLIKDLLHGMLSKVPSQRYTVQQLMNHPFFIEQKKIFIQDIENSYLIEGKMRNKEVQTAEQSTSEKKLGETGM